MAKNLSAWGVFGASIIIILALFAHRARDLADYERHVRRSRTLAGGFSTTCTSPCPAAGWTINYLPSNGQIDCIVPGTQSAVRRRHISARRATAQHRYLRRKVSVYALSDSGFQS